MNVAGTTSNALTYVASTPLGMSYVNDFESPATAMNGLTASGDLAALSLVSLPTDSGGLGSPNQSMWLGKLGAGIGKAGANGEIVTLSLTGLVPNTEYHVAFDLLIGASWDGSATGDGPMSGL